MLFHDRLRQVKELLTPDFHDSTNQITIFTMPPCPEASEIRVIPVDTPSIDETIDRVIDVLNAYRATDAMSVVFHRKRADYANALRTNGAWSLKSSESCLLALLRCLTQNEFYFEYR